MTRLLLALAGLMGACGVALAAAASHVNADPRLALAAGLLLVHAPALLGLAAQPSPRLRWPGLGLAVGAALFSGDMAMRAFADHALFPMAAPTGGVVMILSWLAVSVLAAFAKPQTSG